MAPTRDSRAPEVVYHYTDRGSGFGDPVPLEFRYSNSFRLSQAR